MEIVNVVFWLLLGLLYVGVHFQYQELLIGICALIIGAVQLAALLEKLTSKPQPPSTH
jgi:hypothetical protein